MPPSQGFLSGDFHRVQRAPLREFPDARVNQESHRSNLALEVLKRYAAAATLPRHESDLWRDVVATPQLRAELVRAGAIADRSSAPEFPLLELEADEYHSQILD